MKRHHVAFAFLAVLVFVGSTSLGHGASIVIVNKDLAGVGFNDTTPATPVGGNTGTTLGLQRLNVFQAAANIWGSKLSSAVTIKIAASFGPLTPCDTNQGVIGSAGPTTYYGNFPNAPRTDTYYPVALVSALAGTDYASGQTDGASIKAQFNSNIGTAGCLPTLSWYLGLDANHGSQIDLETVLLHEFGHGLGFVGLVSLSDGSFAGQSYPDVFSYVTYDNSTFMHWNVMSYAQRLASTTNAPYVVFDGSNVTGGASILSVGKDASGHPKLYTPSPAEAGSSIYHFDKTAFPNQLMEPVINSDLTHNVDLPDDLTMKAMLDFGWQAATVAPAAPTGVTATATSATSVTVTWSTVSGATSYEIWRKAAGGSFTKINVSTVTAPPYPDTISSSTAAYLYRVVAVNSGGSSAASTADLATNMIYTDPTLATGAAGTTIKAAHVTELRTAVAAVYSLAGLGTLTSWTNSVATGATIKAADVTDLRTNLDAAITAIKVSTTLSISSGGWTDSSLSGVAVKAAHFTELRSRMN